MVGGADFIKTGDASEKEGLGDAVIGDIIIVCAQVLGMIIVMIVMVAMMVIMAMMAMMAMVVMTAMVMMVVITRKSVAVIDDILRPFPKC